MGGVGKGCGWVGRAVGVVVDSGRREAGSRTCIYHARSGDGSREAGITG